MVGDLGALLQAVAGTPLADLPWEATPILETGWTGLEAPVPKAERYDLQRAARALLPRTGRWPVLIFEGGQNLYHRDRYSHGTGPQAQPDAILKRAREMTAADAKAARRAGEHDDYYRREWEWIVTRELQVTEWRIGVEHVPSRDDVAHLEPPGYDALDRFLFEWEEHVRPTIAREPNPDFDPSWHEEEDTLALLPTPYGYETPAFSDYTMASRAWEHGHDALIVMLRDWHERFGAELVVAGMDYLVLDVARPPTDVLEAYDLACELSLYAGLPDGDRRTYARDLLLRPDWYLQERI